MSRRLRPAIAIALGALLLVWPALYNHYPILFSDTGALLETGLLPSMGWDKPIVYGPLLAATSLRQTLFFPVFAQGLLLSSVLWMVRASPRRHLVLCLCLALLSAAPFVTATLLPDALTPVAALATIISALGSPRWRTPAAVIAAVAIAAHFSHLAIAAALIATLALLRRRLPWRAVASLAAALLFLLASNWIGRGQPAISPYGSVFALARLIGDGPARDYLARVCPGAGFALCRWQDQLTDDSDQFLWDAHSPFWLDPLPLPEFAAQARAIVTGTVATFPLRVLRDAARNTYRQLFRVDLGDTMGSDFLDETVRPRIARWFPAAELDRYDASLQRAGQLTAIATLLRPLHRTALLLGALFAAYALSTARRGQGDRAAFTLCILVALAANAFTGGALSTVHDRYQARLAWLLLLPPFIPQRASSIASAGAVRTSAA